MTLKERIIVECYTGYVMCVGEERKEVNKYIEEKMGHPVFTHQLGDRTFVDCLQKACKEDFLALCKGE